MNLAPNGINLMLDDRDRKWFESLIADLQSLGMQKQVIADQWLEGDQTPFMLKGIPALTFMEKANILTRKTYHSNQDNLELVSVKDIKTCVKVIGIVLQELANTKDIQKWRIPEKEIQQKIVAFGLYDKLRSRKMIN